MIRRVRSEPGSYGLVTANGNYVTKHSFGIYSPTPTEGQWSREDPAVLQAELDAMTQVPYVSDASGPATNEPFHVMHGQTANGRANVRTTVNNAHTISRIH